jgi:ParB-like chromosome segregation protein Spo0J
MKIEIVPIEKINVGERFREDLGDIEKLSESLNEVGLLQPIGVDKYYSLVFGQRRLAAAGLLEWKTIDCHVLDIDSILLGEYTENEFRKQFTASERIAIVKAVKAQMGNRQGQRTDKQLVPDVAQVKGQKTRDIASTKAGFSSHTQMQKAATVVALGTPETVAAMDSGEVSIAAAETIAKLPKEKQAEVVAMPKETRRAAVKDAREKEAAEHRDREVVKIRTFERWVKDIGDFSMEAGEFWDAAGRHLMTGFEDKIERALRCLMRIREGHPNEVKRPRAVR